MRPTNPAAAILLAAGLAWALLATGCGFGDPAARLTSGGEDAPPAAALYADDVPPGPPSGDTCRDEKQRIAELESRVARLQVQINTERADEQYRSDARADRYTGYDDDRYDSSYGADAPAVGEERTEESERRRLVRDRQGAGGADRLGRAAGEPDDGRSGADPGRAGADPTTRGADRREAGARARPGETGAGLGPATDGGRRVELLGQPRVEVGGEQVTVTGRIANTGSEDAVGNLSIELLFDGQVVDSATRVFQVGAKRQVEYSKTFPTPPQAGELTARVRIQS